MWQRCILFVCCLVIGAQAAVYRVGPTRSYTSFTGALLNLLAPGDTVEVDYKAASYGSVVFENSGNATHPITILGLKDASGNRPRFSGGSNTVHFELSNYLVFESFEVTGGSGRCVYHRAAFVTIRDCVVHDCPQQGILGADQGSGSLTLEYSEVYNCGQGTQIHQIYMATNEIDWPGSVFRMQFCYIHNATGGNNVKSRAERNEIYFNWIEGAVYHELELIGPDPAGGVPEGQAIEHSEVIGNVLYQRNSWSVTRFGGDDTGQSYGRYRFIYNTVVTQPGASAVFRLFDGIEALGAHNNILYDSSGNDMKVYRDVEATWKSGRQISGSNNWVVTSRSTQASDYPASFTGSVFASTPRFMNLLTSDLRLQNGSACIGAANTAGTLDSPSGYPFPNPYNGPLFLPPARKLMAVDSSYVRCNRADIGALLSDGYNGIPCSIRPSGAAWTCCGGELNTATVAQLPSIMSLILMVAGALLRNAL